MCLYYTRYFIHIFLVVETKNEIFFFGKWAFWPISLSSVSNLKRYVSIVSVGLQSKTENCKKKLFDEIDFSYFCCNS